MGAATANMPAVVGAVVNLFIQASGDNFQGVQIAALRNNPDADFVVVWMTNAVVTKFRRFKEDGSSPDLTEQVVDTGAGTFYFKSVRGTQDGGFVTAFYYDGISVDGIVVVKHAAAGSSLPAITVQSGNGVGSVYVAGLTSGDFVVAYSYSTNFGPISILYKKYSSSGSLIGSGTLIADPGQGAMYLNDAHDLTGGGFAIMVTTSPSNTRQCHLATFNNNAILQNQYDVDIDSTGLFDQGNISPLDNGGFTATWSLESLPNQVIWQRFNSSGQSTSSAMSFTRVESNDGGYPSFQGRGLLDGSHLMPIRNYSGNPGLFELQKRDSTNTAVSPNTLGGTFSGTGPYTLSSNPARWRIALLTNGNFAVYWRGVGTSSTGIYSQTFFPDTPLKFTNTRIIWLS